MPRSTWRDPVTVLLVALAVRALFAWETRADPVFDLLVTDARSYHDLAARFAGGDVLFGREPLWFAPLYPVLLGIGMKVAGPDPAWVRLVQMLAGAVTAALVTRLGGRVSRRAGLTGGLLFALAPVPVFYETQLLYATLAVVLTAVFLLLLVRAMEAPTDRRALAAGAGLGLLALVRTNVLLFLPVGAWLLARRAGWRRAVPWGAGVALLLAPVLARNGIVAGAWTPLTVNGGFLFADSFAAESVGGRAGMRSPDDYAPHGAFHREAERALGRTLTLAEASRYHRDRTLARLEADPGHAAALALRKLRLLVSARELDDNLGFPMVRERARTLAWLPAPWAWLVVPAAVGAVLAWRARGPAGHVAMAATCFLATYAASLLLFFVNARYRLPLAVPCAVLAGVGVDLALRPGKGRRPGRLAAAVAGVVVATLALTDPGARTDPAFELLAVGAALERQGHPADALAAMDAAIALEPGLPAAHHNRALALLELGRRQEALRAEQEAVRLDPGLAPAWMTLGAVLAEDGRLEEALPAFRHAAELLPRDAAALANLARALHATGQDGEAVEVGRRAVAAGAQDLAPLVDAWESAGP